MSAEGNAKAAAECEFQVAGFRSVPKKHILFSLTAPERADPRVNEGTARVSTRSGRRSKGKQNTAESEKFFSFRDPWALIPASVRSAANGT